MNNDLGYTKNLFILPFDHRASFAKMFGFTNLTQKEKEYIVLAKKLIYEAFKKAVSQSVPQDQSAILVDEEYSDVVLKDATQQGFTTILTTEKSGQEGFTFEYGRNFTEHIEKYNPTFAKALIRYNPNVDWSNLKVLSDYCHNHGHKFLLEMLMGLDSVNAQNFLPAIERLRKKGIEPDVWKLEGMENKSDYESVVAKIREGDRQNVGLVILGRGESKEQVEEWIKAGKNVKGVIGFAVGRTMFSQPLIDYKNGKIDEEKLIGRISNNFQQLYKLFIS
ncbi:MAG: DUF2090 domain-containing protein [Candidatus Levybacteria bacterium]|nr:DUF2090 domain-containing protein [Candidatus Levybacteria bacterium]